MSELVDTEEPLRADPTPILKLTPDEPEPELTAEQEELKQKRIKAQRCKVIALDMMGLHPIKTNVSNLKKTQKIELLKLVEDMFEADEDVIIKSFNKVCIEKVFNGEVSYENFPIYTRPIPSI